MIAPWDIACKEDGAWSPRPFFAFSAPFDGGSEVVMSIAEGLIFVIIFFLLSYNNRIVPMTMFTAFQGGVDLGQT